MTKLKSIALVGLLALSVPALAHDGGHGPKLADTGQYGGLVTAVVDKKDAGLGAKAPLVHKAELARSEDGTVRVYLHDKDMKALPAGSVDPTATALVIAMKDGKEVVMPFELKLEGNAFVGKLPAIPARPYNIDVTYKAKDRELLSAFDNLD